MKANTKKVRTLASELRRIGHQVPYIAMKTINDIAFDMKQRTYPAQAKQNMTLRKPSATLRGFGVNRASVNNLVAEAGSTRDYMAIQEEGAIQGKNGKHGVPLPAAAPGNRKKRKRNPPRANWFKNIETNTPKGNSTAHVVKLSKIKAERQGMPLHISLTRGRRKGIYRVDPSKRRLLTKVWDLSKNNVTIPENPMAQKAGQESAGRATYFFRKHLGREVAKSKKRLRA